jgi:hypothetical protein
LPISRRGTLFRYRIEWKSAISIEKLYRWNLHIDKGEWSRYESLISI